MVALGAVDDNRLPAEVRNKYFCPAPKVEIEDMTMVWNKDHLQVIDYVEDRPADISHSLNCDVITLDT